MPQPDEPVTVTASDPWGLIASAWAKPLRITEVVYSFTTKINLGNYESCDVFTSAKAPVDPDRKADDVYDELREWVRDKVRTDVEGVRKKLASRITEPRSAR